MALLLNEGDVRSLLTMAEAIRLTEAALKAFSTGQVVQPVRTVIPVDGSGFLGVMPGYARAGMGLGLKVVTFYARNAERGLPTHLAAILLFEPESGQFLSIMDGRLITEVRTAAVSAVATRVLARPEAKILAILGSGVQARSHLEALVEVRPFERVRVWTRTRAHAETFAREMGVRFPVAIEVKATAEEAVRGADVVVTVTSSRTPVLQGQWLSPGAHINAVGACRPDYRELDTDAVVRARVFVDSRDAALTEAGDLLIPIQEGSMTAEHIQGEIGEVLAGVKAGRQRSEEITLFKSLGLAVEDVVTARFVYGRALEAGVGAEFTFQ